MKKIIYTLAIALFSTFAFTSCTEEEVAPSTQETSTVGVNYGDEVKK